ncbi:PhzF family phenazine biosynthesis protein [Hoyosella sp. YIM 151337]|uniref:PhzF family phenazine biosynthesis protein n=1 Tax=Hoyosella sp. YIM 151337 TaxID=2992742 RepID=UPI00223604E8|nr:PhzF family phenazine biosynthesis protein [Hoyosella sp. YIM 151337]MCW4355283.1 PhzF family phenazine biosynthesis protein [Hoyosella sp. YIM 151337]
MPPFWIVDAFTSAPFEGNPAAVVLMDTPYDAAWAQRVAAEFNLSETAFARHYDDRSGWELRWFTPTTEVDLCGHATLATAHVLASETSRGPIRFFTRSGELVVTSAEGRYWMDFPSAAPTPAAIPPGLHEALDAQPLGVWSGATGDLLAELPDAEALRQLKPNMSLLKQLPARGVIVTAPATAPYDFVSRFFAPAVGVPEDPVTGSAHTVLAPFWADRLNRSELFARQISQRGGDVLLRLEKPGRVLIGGSAVTIMSGSLSIPNTTL